MKRYLLLLSVAALAFVFAGCDKEKDGDDTSALQGKWTAFMDNHHPLDITFEKNTYTWHVGGVTPQKETGTYTYSGSIITLKGEKFWSGTQEWDQQGNPGAGKDWVESSEGFGTHKYKVLSVSEEELVLEGQGEDIHGSGYVFHMFHGDGQTLTAEDLKGTWEAVLEGGSGPGQDDKYRFTFNGSSYELRELYYNMEYNSQTGEGKSTLVCSKQNGTWTHASGKLKLTPSKLFHSYAIVNMNPLKYNYYDVNTTTMEAVEWYEITSPDGSEWSFVKSGDKLLALIQMMPVEFTKKR
jgi:hypothetical protein